jgi:hypothetical protein
MRKLLLTGLLLVLCSALLLPVQRASAQTSSNGTLGGLVEDASKALIPGVGITLTNVQTNVVQKTLTNETGAYAFLSVPPGLYNVTAELLGFRTSVRNGVQIGTAAQVRVNFTLEIGERTDRVEITASTELALIETSATVGDILPEYRIRQLPMATNNILDLLDILPGFEFGPPGFGGVGSTETVAGLSMNTVNMTRDGLTLSDFRYDPQTWGRQVMSPTSINPDLVGEIRLILTPVDAEIGRGNGQIQVQTRSGTNRFTGTATWGVRNSALNANTWSNNLNTTNGVWDPTPLDWINSHQYSVSLGGPIIRNKTFFFALWDQQITRSRELQSPTVLTDTARLGIFRYWEGWNPTNYLAGEEGLNFPVAPATATVRSVNDAGLPVAPTRWPDGTPYTGSLRCFSTFGNMRLDAQGGLVPFTNADCQFGSVVGQAVSGPSGGGVWDPVRSTFDSTGFIRKVLSNMPRADYFGGGDGLNTAQHRWLQGLKGSNEGNAARGGDSLVSRKQINLKIDQNLSRHRISGSWTKQLDNSEDLLSTWPGGLHGAIERRPNVFTVNVTSTLSSDLLNEARFGLNRNTTDRAPAWLHPNESIRQEAQDLITVPGGLNPLTGEQYTVVINPSLTGAQGTQPIGGGFMSVGTFVIGSSLVGNVTPLYNLADTVSWTRGRHALKFGMDVRIASSKGWNQPPYPIVTLGNTATNTVSPFGTLTNFATELPGFLANARGSATNLNYWLTGSVSSVQAPYWITSHQDVVNGQDPNHPMKGWQDFLTTGEYRIRKHMGQEYAAFFKDDWKLNRQLTLNLGLRWEYYAPRYLDGGFTSAVNGLGDGFWGAGRGAGQQMFDTWLSPGNLYLAGYGSTAVNPNPYQCVVGQRQSALLPLSTCDPNQLMQVEFIGPNSPNPDKTAWPRDKNNFGPAVGFSWQLPWFGEGKTTVRGGYQITYGTTTRDGVAVDTLLGSAPNSVLTPTTVNTDADVAAILATRALNLTDIPALTPVRPTSAPGRVIPIYSRSLGFTQYEPNFDEPYVQNLNLSVTRLVSRNISVDVRYVGTLARKQLGTVDLNTVNVYHNPELMEALTATRAGQDHPLFDQMLAGLNISGAAASEGYGAVGTTVSGRLQRGSAHLRRSSTFSQNLANGNFVAVVNSLIGLVPTAAQGRQAAPNDPATGVAVSGVSQIALRNGCDRIANGLYNPAAPASASNIPTRCFPEDYFIVNPQLTNATYNANIRGSNYHSLQTQFTLRPTKGINFQATWAWTKSLGLDSNTWSDPLDRNANYRQTVAGGHSLRLNGGVELPIGPNKILLGNSSGWVARLVERWQTSVIFNLSAGTMNSLTGAGTMTYGNNRLDVVSPLWEIPEGEVRWDRATANGPRGSYYGDPSPYISVADPQCSGSVVGATDSMGRNLQTDCTLTALGQIVPPGTAGAQTLPGDGRQYVIVLQNPLPGKIGTLGERNIPGLGRYQFDANLSKTFQLTESKSLQFRADFTNVLNHPSPGNIVNNQFSGNPSTAITTFGNLTTKEGSREIRASLRLTF